MSEEQPIKMIATIKIQDPKTGVWHKFSEKQVIKMVLKHKDGRTFKVGN